MHTIIPVKPFEQAKTRLAPTLSLEERMTLSRSLLLRTIRVARQVGEVVIISRQARVRRIAKEAGAWALVESSEGLNRALTQAAEWIRAREGEAALILPGDLPLLTTNDLHEIIALGQRSPAVVLAPCRREEGTNALFTRPAGVIEFRFGENSFEKHQAAATAANITPMIYRSPTIALDLDVPDDLTRLKKLSTL